MEKDDEIKTKVVINKYDHRTIDMLADKTENVSLAQNGETTVQPGSSMTSQSGASSVPARLASVTSSSPKDLKDVFMFEDETSAHHNRTDRERVFSSLLRQVDLGAHLMYARTLVKCYVAGMWVEDSATCLHILDTLLDILCNNLQTSADELYSFGDELRTGREWIKSILFYHLSAKFYVMESGNSQNSRSNAEGIADCTLGIRKAAVALLEENSASEQLVKSQVLPIFDQLKLMIEKLKNLDDGFRAVKMVYCLHRKEGTIGFLDENDEQAETIILGLQILTNMFPNDHMKYRLYGVLTGNLGSVSYDKGLYSKAATLFLHSITSYNAATDYQYESERKYDIEVSERSLKQALDKKLTLT